jgi:hypothetical protein
VGFEQRRGAGFEQRRGVGFEQRRGAGFEHDEQLRTKTEVAPGSGGMDRPNR